MANFKFRTRNNGDVEEKPQVYFTCHPADFDRYYEKICRDIFLLQDCVIFCTEDEAGTDFGDCDLVVVPVTGKLLTQPNRAMDQDVPSALYRHIPVLPILMEPGIETLYAAPEKFGRVQYIDPNATDIAYVDILKIYLETVLVGGTLGERMRADAQTFAFLHSRKKDRQYAVALKEKEYALRCEIFGNEHPDTLGALRRLVWTGCSFGEAIEALELAQKAYGQCHSILGEEHPDTLSVMHGLARCLSKLERHREALAWMEKTYDLAYKALGENDLATVEALWDLATCCGKVGNKEKEQELRHIYLTKWAF